MTFTVTLAASFSFLFLALVFWPLERFFPARKQKVLRPEWWTDLAFFLGQYLLWGALVLFVVQWISTWIVFPASTQVRQAVAGQPWWLQAIEVVVFSDMLVYWGHRLQHKIPLLWRFHSIHHSAEHLDWMAAHREHPLDTIYTLTLVNLPFFVLGFSFETLAGFLAFRGVWAIFIHSNVKLPIGPLRMLIGAPELHHWHHSRLRVSYNYGNLSPLMDLIFGTYYCPDEQPEELGLTEPISRSYLGQLLHPFRKKS